MHSRSSHRPGQPRPPGGVPALAACGCLSNDPVNRTVDKNVKQYINLCIKIRINRCIQVHGTTSQWILDSACYQKQVEPPPLQVACHLERVLPLLIGLLIRRAEPLHDSSTASFHCVLLLKLLIRTGHMLRQQCRPPFCSLVISFRVRSLMQMCFLKCFKTQGGSLGINPYIYIYIPQTVLALRGSYL